MSSSSFTQKQIEVDFDLISTGQTLTVAAGHRISCEVALSGYVTGSMCHLRIEGMKLSDMNTLSMVNIGTIAQGLNTVTVKAGDAGARLTTIFQGTVIEGFVDYSNSPNIAFDATAMSMVIPNLQPIAPTSYPNGANVADIMQAIAIKGGLNFQNNGVKQSLGGTLYFCGTVADQIDKVVEASRITQDISLNTLRIWPPGIPQSDATPIEISSETGMLGYPAYSQSGVDVTTLFNPAVVFHSNIKLSSKYAPAAWVNSQGQLNQLAGGQNIYPASNGIWVAVNVKHDLQSETPNGKWETAITAARPEFAGQIAFPR
jgi:hypothetical protein